MHARSALNPILLVMLAWACDAAHAAGGRYRYVVGCDARVDKIDITPPVASSRCWNWPCAAACPAIARTRGAIGGCLAQRVVFDEATAIAYLGAARQARLRADRTRAVQLLAFSVAGWHLEGVKPGG